VLLLQAVLIALGAKNDGAFALTNCARVNISELWWTTRRAWSPRRAVPGRLRRAR
jgi:hypothetical protein